MAAERRSIRRRTATARKKTSSRRRKLVLCFFRGPGLVVRIAPRKQANTTPDRPAGQVSSGSRRTRLDAGQDTSGQQRTRLDAGQDTSGQQRTRLDAGQDIDGPEVTIIGAVARAVRPKLVSFLKSLPLTDAEIRFEPDSDSGWRIAHISGVPAGVEQRIRNFLGSEV